jgi:hypothetical protein
MGGRSGRAVPTVCAFPDCLCAEYVGARRSTCTECAHNDAWHLDPELYPNWVRGPRYCASQDDLPA